MDRQIVYVGAVPLDTDQLQQTRNSMVALGYLAKAVIGDGQTVADGLNCTPGGGLSVTIAPGTIFVPGVVDAGYYGALPPDGDALLKTGINTSTTTLPVVAGMTSIISGCLSEFLTGDTVVAYYNPANPSQTLFGPQADGQNQATILAQRVNLVASATGAVPSGNIPLWQVTVPANAASVATSMITAAPGAPFIQVKLPYAAPLNSPAFTGVPTAPTPAVGDASTALATTAFVSAATYRNRAAWGTGGSYGWTCPAGVNDVLARLWGAGGRGGAGGAVSGGGGGGGGYLEVLIAVTPGQSYAVQVGSGTGANRSTAFDVLASVSGGSDGASGSSAGPGVGGACGTAGTSSFNLIAALGVAAGGTGTALAGTAVGGAGGSSFGVSGTAPTLGGPGSAGIWPGGGGAGGASGSGGNGADGLIILEWLG